MKDVLLRILGSAVLAIGLGGLGYLAMQHTPDAFDPTVAEVQTTGSAERPTSVQQNRTRPMTYFRSIAERPLFEITRRPVDRSEPASSVPTEMPVANEEPEPQALPDVRLLGVMSGSDETRLLLSVEGRDPVWFKSGEAIGGWTITSAGTDWLELAADGTTIRLDLFE